jgi:small multidrug resistance pump
MTTTPAHASATRSMSPEGPWTSPARPWMSVVLWIAAAYNLLWGALVVLFPHAIFDLLNVPRLEGAGIAIWQCVGMIVGVYGIGYACAARDPLRHWPIVLVGLLGKIFGPIGFIDAVFIRGIFPASFGWTILTNDLVWWVPFALILLAARRAARHAPQA